MDLIDIYRTFHSKTAEYTFFSSAHETCSRIDQMLGQKANLGKLKKTNHINHLFCSQLEIKYKKKTTCKTHKHMEAEQYTTK